MYAVGVIVCRLVTGAYPRMGEARQEEGGAWRMEAVELPRELYSSRVPPAVRELIQRLHSPRPEQRGTAGQLARELERMAASLTLLSHAREPRRLGRRWLGAAVAAVALAAWLGWWGAEERLRVRGEEGEGREQRREGPVGLGESVASAGPEEPLGPAAAEALAAETPPEPQPGQTRTDAKGRCPRKGQVALNGGGWVELPVDQERCTDYSGHMYRGMCYLPIIPPGRPSTTTPQ